MNYRDELCPPPYNDRPEPSKRAIGWDRLSKLHISEVRRRYDDACREDDIANILVYGGELDERNARSRQPWRKRGA